MTGHEERLVQDILYGGRRTIDVAPIQAPLAEDAPEPKFIECPYCDHGSFFVRGQTKYEGTAHRCAYCKGTGRVLQP